MIEGDHIRILINEAAPDELIGILDRERPVLPSPVGQHDTTKAPVIDEFFPVDVPTDLGFRDEFDAGLSQLLADCFVFLLAKPLMPPRQSVFDLAEGTGI